MEELMADNILVIGFPHVKGRGKQGESVGIDTAKNIVVSPNLLVWTFCGKAQFLHSFGRFVRNYAETVPFNKISTTGNDVKLPYSLHWSYQK